MWALLDTMMHDPSSVARADGIVLKIMSMNLLRSHFIKKSAKGLLIATLSLTGLAGAITRVPGTYTYFSSISDPITDVNTGNVLIDELYDQSGDTYMVFKCASAGQPGLWAYLGSKNDLITQADADASRFPNVVIRLGTDAPIQVPAYSQTSVSGANGTFKPTSLGFSTTFAQSMISGLLANKKLVVRVTRTTGSQPLTFMFPAAGFSTGWNNINQCRSTGPGGTAGSGSTVSVPLPSSVAATTTGGTSGAPRFVQWAFTGCVSQGRTTSFLVAGQGSACGLNIDFIPNGALAISAEFRYELEYVENGAKGKLVLDGVDRWSAGGGGNVQAQLFSNRLAFQVPLNVRLRPMRRYTSINVIASVVFDNGSSKRVYEPLPITQP